MIQRMWRRYAAVLAAGIVLAAAPAAAQNAFGAGPMTSSLIDTEPTTGVVNLAHLKVAPGLTVQELGRDSNVFDEKDNPKEDYVFRGTPDASVFTRTRFSQFSGYVGVPLAYYNKYSGERSAGLEYRGRFDLLAGRLRPFAAGARTRARTRPNGVIDVRADQLQSEWNGGIGYDLSAHSLMYVAAHEYHAKFIDARERGVDLADALNHNSRYYSAGVRTALTPLANLTVSGGMQQDRFKTRPDRDADRTIGSLQMNIGAEAALSGMIGVSYQDTRPVDPLIVPFRGISSQIGVTYPFLEIGRFTLRFNRGFEYSFDAEEAYYKETTGILSYTHRLFNSIDLRAEATESLFDYGFRAGVPARRDELQSLTGSLGYNLRNRTRVALNYERARRRSPVFEDRNYDRERLFLSWTFAY